MQMFMFRAGASGRPQRIPGGPAHCAECVMPGEDLGGVPEAEIEIRDHPAVLGNREGGMIKSESFLWRGYTYAQMQAGK